MVELVFGSIFDRKCDIIVVPCNNMGGVTETIKEDFVARGIFNTPSMEIPGKIVFSESKGDFNNAIIIGFAISVDCYKGKSDIEFYMKMVDYLKKALIYGHTSRILS